MAQLALKANPTFKAKVAIPVPGAAAVEVEMTFKHRTATDLAAFIDSRKEAKDVDSFLSMVSGWELEAELNADNVAALLENYMGAGVCTFRTYLEQLTKSKSGN